MTNHPNREFLELYTRLENCLDAAENQNLGELSMPRIIEGDKRVGKDWYIVSGALAIGEIIIGPSGAWNRSLVISKTRSIIVAEKIGGRLISISSSVHEDEPRIIIEHRMDQGRSIRDEILDNRPFDYSEPFYKASTIHSRRPVESVLVRLEAALPNL